MDFDFGRFDLPNAGNTGKVPPKKLNSEKAENVATPEIKNIELSNTKKADVSALDVTAAQNLGFVRSANNVSVADAADISKLVALTGTNLDMAKLETYMRNTTSAIYNRTGEAVAEGMNFAMNVGTNANAVISMREFETKMAGESYEFNEQNALKQFMEEAYA